MISDIDAARRQLTQPDTNSMIKHLPDLGESLHNAAIDLSRDCTLDRVDQMLARLQAAATNLTHLRKALAAERHTGHGTG